MPDCFSEFRNQFNTAEEFRSAFGALSYEEAHSLVSAEQVPTQIKATIMTFWRRTHQAEIEAKGDCCPDSTINVSADNIYLKKLYWKQYCENAPSAVLREVLYLQLEDLYLHFYKGENNEEISSRIKYLSGKLNKEDYQYLYENTENGYEKSFYKKMLELYE